MTHRFSRTTLALILSALLAGAVLAHAQEGDESSAPAAAAQAPATEQAPAAEPAHKVAAVTWIHRVDDFVTAADRRTGVVLADRDAARVGFPHAVHTHANVSCESCHHKGLNGYEAQACAACHKGQQAVAVMHKACIDCHQNRTIGPVACYECHTRAQDSIAGIYRFELYDLVRGPFFAAAWVLFALGFAWRVFRFVRLTRAANLAGPAVIPAAVPAARASAEDRAFLERGTPGIRRVFQRYLAWERRTIFSTNPVMARVSMVFHVLLFLVPLLLPAHNILFYQSFRVALPSLPEPAMDILTLVLLAIGAFFLLRRILVPRVRALTTVRDYLILLLVAAPFVTAYMAYHHWLDYRTVLMTHMIVGEIVIASVPFTKLGHMPFMILSRFFAAGEHSWKPGNRRWSNE